MKIDLEAIPLPMVVLEWRDRAAHIAQSNQLAQDLAVKHLDVNMPGFGTWVDRQLANAAPISGERFEVELNGRALELRSLRLGGRLLAIVQPRTVLPHQEFLTNLSHELRTPLNSLLGITELLNETPLTTQQRDYVDVLHRAGEHLLSLINDILNLSKMEAGQIQLQQTEFDLYGMVEQTVEMLSGRWRKKGLRLSVHIVSAVPQRLVGDPQRLRQILVNLLGNAIKFTEKGEVVLRVEPDPEGPSTDPGALLFSVRDTGIGVPHEDLTRIFEPFAQVDSSSTRAHGGTGLGLAIARHFVSLMGGRIWADSRMHRGSTFYFTIRLQSGDKAGSRSTQTLTTLKGRSILVVAEAPTSRLILRDMLVNWNAEVEECDASAASQLIVGARPEPYDIIVFDEDELDIDGATAVLQAAQREGRPAPAVIVVASPSSDETARRIPGVRLSKPLRRRQLGEALAESLEGRAEPGAAAAAGAMLTGQRVLVVDDSVDNRLLVRAFLDDTGVEVEEAGDGASAIQRLMQSPPIDLVLMDVQMPGMDGYAATRAVRAAESAAGRRRVAIVAVTAHALPEHVQKSLDAGCDDHLSKPITRHGLVDMVRRQLGARPAPPIRVTVEPRLRALVPRFLDGRKRDVKALERALVERDYATIIAIGHTLKGLGASYGFPKISESGARIELAAHGKQEAALRDEVAQLRDLLQRIEVV